MQSVNSINIDVCFSKLPRNIVLLSTKKPTDAFRPAHRWQNVSVVVSWQKHVGCSQSSYTSFGSCDWEDKSSGGQVFNGGDNALCTAVKLRNTVVTLGIG